MQLLFLFDHFFQRKCRRFITQVEYLCPISILHVLTDDLTFAPVELADQLNSVRALCRPVYEGILLRRAQRLARCSRYGEFSASS